MWKINFTIIEEMSKDLENSLLVTILLLCVAPENDSVRHGARYTYLTFNLHETPGRANSRHSLIVYTPSCV